MTRNLLMPALIAATLAIGVGPVIAGTVFDFIPRMEFVEKPELVTKDKTDAPKLLVKSKK